MPEPRRNILNFGYGINFKYEAMLSHSFDKFYVVTKFILPTIDDLKFSSIDSDSECNYFNIVETWFSLEQYIGLKEEKTTFLQD